MVLYINGRSLESSCVGVTRYTICVLKKMDLLLSSSKYGNIKTVLFISCNCIYNLKFNNIKVQKVGIRKGVFWEQLELPRYCKNGILLSLHSKGPILVHHHVLVMHDAKSAYKGLDDMGEFHRYGLFLLDNLLGHTCRRIIAISNFTKEDIRRCFHIASDKIQLVEAGMDKLEETPTSSIDISKRFNITSKKYVFSLGGGKSKNNILTAAAVEKLQDLSMLFVLAGNVSDTIRQELKSYKNTKLIGRVTNDELVVLYKNAAVYAFPSLAEGWGRPPVEAMQYGCPVVASRCDSIPEVCGDAAYYLDNPHDPQEMADKLRKVITDDSFRRELITKGYKNIERFDWMKTAKEILDIMVEEMKKIEKG